MKKNKRISCHKYSLLAGLCLTFLLGACNKDDSIVSKGSFDIDSFACSSAGCDTLFSFIAGDEWTASVSNSAVHLSARAGKAGEAGFLVEIPENRSEKERIIVVQVKDKSEAAPYVVNIVQSGVGRFVSFETPTAQIDYDKATGLYQGEIRIFSNIDWRVGVLPKWIENFEYMTDARPANGVVTSLSLRLNAFADSLTPAKMLDELLFEDRIEAGKTYPLPIEFVGFDPYVRSQESVVEIQMDPLRNLLPARLTIDSNEKWEIDQLPEWLSVDSKIGESLNALPASSTMWCSLKQSYLCTTALTGYIVLKGLASGNKYELPISFGGTGDNYVNYDREALFDFTFDAVGHDSNWNPIEGAVLSKVFNIYAPGDFTYSTSQENDAPFKIFLLEAPGGIARKQIAVWAGIDEAVSFASTRSAINGKSFELWVRERGQGVNDEAPGQERVGILLILPKLKSDGKEVDLNDLFDEDGALLAAYSDESLVFKQKGQLIDYYFDSEIPEKIEMDATGGKLKYYFDTNSEALNWLFENQYDVTCNWVSCEFKFDGVVGRQYLDITVAKNLKATRSAWFSITASVGDELEDQILYERIEIIQKGQED